MILPPSSPELRRLADLLRLLSISRLRALSRGTPAEYDRALARFCEVTRQHDAEAARIGAPAWHERPALPRDVWFGEAVR